MRESFVRIGLTSAVAAAGLTVVRLASERSIADAYGYAVKQTVWGSLIVGAVALVAAAIAVAVVLRRRRWGWHLAGVACAWVFLLAIVSGPSLGAIKVTFEGTPWPLVLLDVAEAFAFLAWVTASMSFGVVARWPTRKATPSPAV